VVNKPVNVMGSSTAGGVIIRSEFTINCSSDGMFIPLCAVISCVVYGVVAERWRKEDSSLNTYSFFSVTDKYHLDHYRFSNLFLHKYIINNDKLCIKHNRYKCEIVYT
jgi:hypothetical protein